MPRRLCSKINEDSTLELSIENFDTPPLEPDDVLIRIEAAPVNPSDLGLLLGPADVSTARELGKLSEKTQNKRCSSVPFTLPFPFLFPLPFPSPSSSFTSPFPLYT